MVVTTSTTTTTSTTMPLAPLDPEGIDMFLDVLFGNFDPFGLGDAGRARNRTLAADANTRRLVSVAARNGWAIVDYETGDVFGNYLFPFPSPLFAASPLAGESQPGAGLDVQAIVQVGGTGVQITHFDLNAGQFGLTQISPGSGPCFDAAAYGGDPLSGGMVLACGRRLTRVLPTASGVFTINTGLSAFPQTEGVLTSGFRRDQTGPIVALTDGTPGKIWKHPATGATGEMPVEIGASQNSPRRVRCTPNSLCAVSNFGSDSLTVLTWDAQDDIGIVGNVAVGDGPVGVDIRERTDGNVEVVSTGFNDDSYSITVLGQNGGTVSNQKFAAPANCTAPGHAIWGSGNEVILSCNGSDSIVLAPLP